MVDSSVWGTVVGGILGFLASVLPRLFELLDAAYTHTQQREDTAQKIDAAKEGITVTEAGTSKMAVPVEGEVFAPGIAPEDDDNEDTNYQLPVTLEGPSYLQKFWNMFSVTVRPVVTYGFFILFLYVKIRGFRYGLFVEHTPIVQLLPAVWDEGTSSLFAAVLAFWFGSRAFEKSKALSGKVENDANFT